METQTQFYRDTWVEINLDDLKHNVTSIKKHLPQDVHMFAVVKANAYGHGDIQVAKTALENGAHGLAVAFLDEALALRRNGIDAPILVLGATRPENVKLACENKISLTVFYYDWLKEARKFLNVDDLLNLHVKCDTGMGRIGVREVEDLKMIEEYINTQSNFVFEGLFTHFATADELDESYYRKQLKTFLELKNSLEIPPKYIHSANSAATLRFAESHFNSVRVGISMYGLSPSIEIKDRLPFELKQVFSLHSRLSLVKKLSEGEKVSYGATYETSQEEWIGTIPIGYADGWLRKLQGQEILVNNKRAPIIGRICMDQCMVKLSEEIPLGEKVTLIGSQGEGFISMDEVAKRLDTINYEIPCIISNRVPRIYIQNEKPIEVSNKLLVSSDFLKNHVE
ncbi:alanine racemase [Bacillus pakistanensis]|uniref:Alanine racemase n=1 Tax=Rossellomorea pakistanensis TaxID=992288 RepID=A0ABS2NJJ3_9BACI|nr:alanine racemase [Bacillus pakistanensis]MBM7588022.1 alanine racemase [Bacillus pakistanensis]